MLVLELVASKFRRALLHESLAVLLKLVKNAVLLQELHGRLRNFVFVVCLMKTILLIQLWLDVLRHFFFFYLFYLFFFNFTRLIFNFKFDWVINRMWFLLGTKHPTVFIVGAKSFIVAFIFLLDFADFNTQGALQFRTTFLYINESTFEM